MGDDDQRAAPRLEPFGQPGDAGDVEMVGRLVEREQVEPVEAVGDEQGGQRDPAPLAAAERRGVGVEAVGQAEAGHGVARARHACPLMFAARAHDDVPDGAGG